MKNGYKALAVSARKQAMDYQAKMDDALVSLDESVRAKAGDYKALALYQLSEAKVYDKAGAEL